MAAELRSDRGAPSFSVDGRDLVATDERGGSHRFRVGRSVGEAAVMALMQNRAPVGRNRAVLAIIDGNGRWLAVAPLRGYSAVEAGRFATAAGLELREVDEPTDAEVRRAIARDQPVDLARSSFNVVIGVVLVAAFTIGIVLAVTGVLHPAVAIIGVPVVAGAALAGVAVIQGRRGA